MLVLTRKSGQSVVFDGDIKITILSVEGDKVSVGIDAPKSIKVFRSELLDETRNINRQSVGSISNLVDVLKSEKK